MLVPLFSLASSRGWGIGEIGDIDAMTRWLGAARHRVLQLLPINELPPGETSPYSALSAMAIDPQFITLAHVEDFVAIGGEDALEPSLREKLDHARRSPHIDYLVVRELKDVVLRRCFGHFRQRHWERGTLRAAALSACIDDQRWWLDDYALFRALHAELGETCWTEWPEAIRERQPQALAAARDRLADEILFRQYLQWVAGAQWQAAREDAGAVALFGDLQFMVGRDSADVWARQDEFRLDASIGVPPDAFSATGQDWGLPVYRWDVVAAGGFEWLRHRARRNADLYDGYRIDHLVGFYRTYYRPLGDGEAGFTPSAQGDQIALGERILSVLRDTGVEVVAEDLGIVPDFIRESLARLGVAGYKVFRWEREWTVSGQPFRDPEHYSPVSVATSGTHDTEPMVVWWEEASRDEREAVLATPSIRAQLTTADLVEAAQSPAITRAVREALLAVLYGSGSNLVLLPIQDVFGWRDRINQPATVSTANWTWRLPWPVDRLESEPAAIERARQLKAWCESFGR